jgi:hypothetical protein
MAEPYTVSNATLYSLLKTVSLQLVTVRVNQTQIIIQNQVALRTAVAAVRTDIAALRGDLDSKAAALEAELLAQDLKLDEILLQVTPPETGDLNLNTGIITTTKE